MRRILIIILILLVVATGVWYFYIRPRQAAGISPVPNVLKSFFPTSTSSTGSFGTGTNPSANGTGTGGTAATSPFKQITALPIAGYTIFSISNQVSVPSVTDPTAKPTVETVVDHMIRYVSRPNGYVYEIKDGGIPLQISNIFIPNIYEADFADSNNTAILRFLRSDDETIATYSVPIPPLNTDGTRTQKSGTYLPDNISELAVSPDSTEVARVTTNSNGAIISTSNTSGGSIKTMAQSPFTEWVPMWAGKTLYIQTKAAAVANGFLYSINPSTARLQRVVGSVPGLTASVSPSGTYVLYSQSTATGFTTELLNTKTNTTTDLSLDILPEKCAWLQNEDLICAGSNSVPAGTYPDEWYAGTLHFSDQLYHIATASDTYTVLYNDENTSESFDMTNLQVDEGQQIVYFIDKSTGLLWQFSYGS